MNIDFDFACRDDCLDQMVPSDLRVLVSERDAAVAEVERLRGALQRIATPNTNGIICKEDAMVIALDALDPPTEPTPRPA